MDIKHFIETTEMTLQQIADHLGITYKRVYTIWKKYPAAYRKARKVNNYRKSKLGVKNPMNGRYGNDHHNYVGLVSDSKGYLMQLKPAWYTGRKGSKHVFAHSIVVCENLSITEIPKGWVIHHCDENPHNNCFSNLVMLSIRDHARKHSALAGSTTISKESTLKWVETYGTVYEQ